MDVDPRPSTTTYFDPCLNRRGRFRFNRPSNWRYLFVVERKTANVVTESRTRSGDKL